MLPRVCIVGFEGSFRGRGVATDSPDIGGARVMIGATGMVGETGVVGEAVMVER